MEVAADGEATDNPHMTVRSSRGDAASPLNFFIAYASPDRATADRLYELLVRESTVFLDHRSLQLGDDWDQELSSAQQRADVTVVLVSDHTEEGFYQREEIAAAIEMARRGSHRVVPIWLTGEAQRRNVPYGLRVKYGVQVSDPGELEDVARQLLLAVRRRDSSPAPATATSPATPSELPPELLEAISSEAEGRRVEDVAELGRLLHASPGEAAEQARALLQQLIDDDSRPVSQAAIRALTTRPSGYWTRGKIELLYAELTYPGARALLDEAAHRAPRSVLLREVSERTGNRAKQISSELGAMTKLCKRLFGRDAWPVTVRSTADGASYQMDPEIAQWWRQASDPDAQPTTSHAQPTTTTRLATSTPNPESGLHDLAPALEIATRVAADRRQGAVPLEFASVDDAAAYRDRLRSALTERTAAGDMAIGHVRPWVWTPASSGRALTEAGNRTGVEVRLSYYR